jgi:hypothetical protein
MEHLEGHDSERYYLGMVSDEAELAVVEENLLWCHACLDRMEASERYVDAIRAGAVRGGFDIGLMADECKR